MIFFYSWESTKLKIIHSYCSLIKTTQNGDDIQMQQCMQDWLTFTPEVVVKAEYVDGVTDLDDDFVLMTRDKAVHSSVSDLQI